MKLTPLAMALFLMPALLASCSATQLYPGPERPAAEISRVYYHSTEPAELSAMAIDDTEQKLLDVGFDIEPGAHRFSTDYRLAEHDCTPPFGCTEVEHSGTCAGELHTEPGKEYLIRIVAFGDSATATVTAVDSFDSLGEGECREQSQLSTHSRRR